MRKTRLPFLLLLWLASGLVWRASAEEPAARGMSIDPATTGIPLGHARLSVDPLTRAEGKEGLGAAYKVAISPFSSKSEAGQFSVALSAADLRRLMDGEQVSFTGRADSQDGTNHSTVQGRATPAADRHGSGEVRLEIESKKGRLVFHTTYHLTTG